MTNMEATLLGADPVYVATDAVASSGDAGIETLAALEVWRVVYAWFKELLTSVLEVDWVTADSESFPVRAALPELELVSVGSLVNSELEADATKVTVELDFSVASSGTDSDAS